MKVEAMQKGFYEQLRNPGDIFNISGEKAFSQVWMKKLKKTKPKSNVETEKIIEPKIEES